MSVSEKGAGNFSHCNLPFFFNQQGPDSSIALGNSIVVWKKKHKIIRSQTFSN